MARGILYAPDYVINAGGIINVSVELLPGGYDESASLRQIDRIYDNLRKVFEISRRESIPTNEAAARLAEQRLASGREARARTTRV
jgi:leucine dehydrogenase